MTANKRVRVFGGMILLVLGMLLVACGGASEPVQAPEAPAAQEAVPSEGEAPPPAEGEAPPPPAEGMPPGDCVETNPHPIGQSIADTFDTVTYDQVMAWFCAGSTFDDILLALETNAQTGVPVDDLLAQRAAGVAWEQIWQDIGLLEPPA